MATRVAMATRVVRKSESPRRPGLPLNSSQLVTQVAGTPLETHNLAFHSNAFALVTRPLAPPDPGTGATGVIMVDEDLGIAMRYTRLGGGDLLDPLDVSGSECFRHGLALYRHGPAGPLSSVDGLRVRGALLRTGGLGSAQDVDREAVFVDALHAVEHVDDVLRLELVGVPLATNSYAGIPESHLKALGSNRIDYHVVNEDGANSITAKVVGRYKQEGGGASAWFDASAEAAIAGGGTNYANFTLTDLVYDEYAVQVKSTSGGSHGDANCYGSARHVPDRANTVPELGATLTPIAEVADEIDVTVQLSKAEARPVHLELFIGAQVTQGPLVQAATAAFHTLNTCHVVRAPH